MPFTLSHAAAAWPFRKTRLEMPALLIGCFAPDFAYFMFIRSRGAIGHSLLGAFIFDLPVSLAVLWLFYAYVRQPFLMLLPKGFRRRLKPGSGNFSFWPPARLALIVVSILIGTATHILWDSFTHPFYWPYRHWSFLSDVVQVPVAGNMPMFKALQYASTLFGLVFVAVWIWSWYRATKPVESPLAKIYTPAQIGVITIAAPAVALAGGIVRAYLILGDPEMTIRSLMYFGVDWVITATTLLWLGLLICGAVFKRRSAPMKAV
ncbi:MAG: DUF4184 family protein [Terracidiphilus sp.]